MTAKYRIRGKSQRLINALGTTPIPNKLDPERQTFLTNEIRKGTVTKEQLDEIARGFFRLAIYIAGCYAAKVPGHEDDFISCALFGLVKALAVAHSKLVDDGLTPYLSSAINSTCRRYAEKAQIFGLSACQRWRLKHEGKTVPYSNRIPLAAIQNGVFGVRKDKVHDLKEAVEASVSDDLDRQIVKLRIDGYNDREISELLGESQSNIYRRRQVIKARFDRLTQ